MAKFKVKRLNSRTKQRKIQALVEQGWEIIGETGSLYVKYTILRKAK